MTIERYNALVASGVYDERDKIELIDGLLVEKIPKGDRHVLMLRRLIAAISAQLPPTTLVTKEDPLTLSRSKPEPDLMVVSGDPASLESAEITAADVAAVIEVADSSLNFDLGAKADAYAAGGVGLYYVVDLPNEKLWRHTGPSAAGFGQCQSVRAIEVESLSVIVAIAPLFERLGEVSA